MERKGKVLAWRLWFGLGWGIRGLDFGYGMRTAMLLGLVVPCLTD